jgi:hypothetical protein
MTSAEAAARFGTSPSTARNWAAKNNVGRKITGGILAFDWTEDDCRRFAARRKPGWKKGRSRK